MDVAMHAGFSARHISFIETGKARPSRDALLAIAESLDVPLRDRNRLLTAGGFANVYRETQLAAADILPVAEVRTDEITRDARLHIDAGDRFEPADEVVPVHDLAGERSGDRDFGRRRSPLRFASARASRGRERQDDGRNG